MFKRNDIILIIIVLLIAVVSFAANLNSQGDGGKAIVKIDGQVDKEFQLSEDEDYTINFKDGRYNTLSIKDGYVQMIEASCPDQICVNHKKIDRKSVV